MVQLNCKNCQVHPLCCSSVKVAEEDVDKILKITQKPFSEVFRWTNDGIYTKKQDKNLKDEILSLCILLDLNTNLCKAYEARPRVCKDWKCPE